MLLGAISNHAEIPEEGRQLAAVMLRRLFSSEFDDFFGKVRRKLVIEPDVDPSLASYLKNRRLP